MKHAILVCLAAPLLVGCGDDGGDAETEASSDGSGTTEDVSVSSVTVSVSSVTSDDASGPPPTNSSGSTEGTTAPDDTGDPSNGEESAGEESSSSDTADTGSSAESSSGNGDCEGMKFFATSTGSGVAGGNLGGLDGADAKCQRLAAAVGQGACTWQAYLSTDSVDARDRIGAGPWTNADGDEIAADVASLHADGLSNDDPQHMMDENGEEIPASEHDILTGSDEDGTYLAGATCENWTTDSGPEGARVGHTDIPNEPFSPSWNSAHTVGDCDENALDSTNGSGRLYCFAIG